jgi:hypothetical protein
MANPPVIPLRTQGRSRVSNASTLWLDEKAVDGRSKAARRFRDVYETIISDLGGDEGRLSEGQRQIARRCAMLSVSAELAEASAVAGEAFDAEAYGIVCDRLGRAFQRLGLKRVKKDRAPTIHEIASRYRAPAAVNTPKPSAPTITPPGAVSSAQPPPQLSGAAVVEPAE